MTDVIRTRDENIALFDQIKALAEVDYRQANSLAQDSGLIVTTSHEGTGLLIGVDSDGFPRVSVKQRSWDMNVAFSALKPTGYVWKEAS